MTNVVLKKDVETFVIEITEKHGYVKGTNGYFKKTRSGRFHIIITTLEKKHVVNLHYDKFKGKARHATRQSGTRVDNELKKIF